MIYRPIILILFITFAVLVFVWPRIPSLSAFDLKAEAQSRAPQQTRSQRRPRPAPPPIDYSNFSHHRKEHQQACDSCHKFPSENWNQVRKADEAFPDITEYPLHASCLNCHRQQFYSGAQPVICSICHVNVTPRGGPRYPFPSLGEAFYATKKAQSFASDFQIGFRHDIHVELVGRAQPDWPAIERAGFVRASHAFSRRVQTDQSCSFCHQTMMPEGQSGEEYVTAPPKDLGDRFWLKRGTFKTTPLTHTNCFTCHSQDSGITPAPNDCNACHKLSASHARIQMRSDFDPKLAGAMGVTDNLILLKWRKRDSSGTFRHEGGMHPALECSSCHKVETMNTIDAKTLKIPILSCAGEAGCHVTSTADEGGILNFEIDERKSNPSFQCSKCHITFGRDPIPPGHASAITALGTK